MKRKKSTTFYLRINSPSKWKEKIQKNHWQNQPLWRRCNSFCCHNASGSWEKNIHQLEFSHFGIQQRPPLPRCVLETIILAACEGGSYPAQHTRVFWWLWVLIPTGERAYSHNRGCRCFKWREMMWMRSCHGRPAVKFSSVLTRWYYINAFPTV